jgi:hypothetical protein
MRDKPSLRIDDIGVAALADLDLRNDVQMSLRLTSATVTPRPGDG